MGLHFYLQAQMPFSENEWQSLESREEIESLLDKLGIRRVYRFNFELISTDNH